MAIEMRPLEEADLAALSALFRRVYDRERTPEHYRWKFLAPLPPFCGPRMWTAWDGAVMVACAGMLTYPFWWQGREHLGVTTCEYHTHPDYRRRGLVSDLQAKLFASLAPQGAVYAMALPNQNLAPLLAKTGYVTQFQARWFIRSTAWWLNCLRKPPSGRVVRTLAEPGAECDAAWARVRGEVDACVVSGASWLRYRYRECPTHQYEVLLAEDDLGPCGILVVGKKNVGKRSEAVIASYLVRPDDDTTVSALLRFAVQWAQRERLATLRAMVGESPTQFARWRAWHFRETPYGYPLAVCPLGESEVPLPMRSPDTFWVHLGDHDFI